MTCRVKLISVSTGVGELKDRSAQDIISYAARVSSPKNQSNFDTAAKLLAYCIKNKHWSIFEVANMVLEIETSISIATQILRHKSFSFQQYSQRYSDSQEAFIYPARTQDKKNRQNSFESTDKDLNKWFETTQEQTYAMCFNAYRDALNRGIAKEQARFLLPLATKTRLYMAGNIRSWIHYIQLRSANGTQKEHQAIALQAKDIFCEQLPDIAQALEW